MYTAKTGMKILSISVNFGEAIGGSVFEGFESVVFWLDVWVVDLVELGVLRPVMLWLMKRVFGIRVEEADDGGLEDQFMVADLFVLRRASAIAFLFLMSMWIKINFIMIYYYILLLKIH